MADLENYMPGLKDGSVTIGASNLATDSVTAAKIAAGAVGTSEIADNTVATADVAVALAQRTQVTLTTAQIKALNTTPIALVAAQGAGTYVIIDEITALNNHGGTDYALGGAVIISYTNGSGDKACTDIAEAAWAEASADALATTHGIDCIPVANAAVVVSAGTSDPTTGDGDWKFDVLYRVVTIAT